MQQLELISVRPGTPQGYTASPSQLLHTGAVGYFRFPNKAGSFNGNWKGGTVNIKCMVCGSQFSVKPYRALKAKCCSLGCWNEYQKQTHPKPKSPPPTSKGIRKKIWAEKHCKQCGGKFECRPYLANTKLFCSLKCRIAWTAIVYKGEGNPSYKHGGKKICIGCGAHFVDRGRQKYCSTKCWYKIGVGEKAPNWKGGATTENGKLRSSDDYASWRLSVFTRDKFICQECGKYGGGLTAHHIRKFSKYENQRLFIPNGITLCWPCHLKINGKEEFHAERLSKKVEMLL